MFRFREFHIGSEFLLSELYCALDYLWTCVECVCAVYLVCAFFTLLTRKPVSLVKYNSEPINYYDDQKKLKHKLFVWIACSQFIRALHINMLFVAIIFFFLRLLRKQIHTWFWSTVFLFIAFCSLFFNAMHAEREPNFSFTFRLLVCCCLFRMLFL